MDGRVFKVSELKSFPNYGYIDNDPNRPYIVDRYDKVVTTDLFVPNGTWVMERPYGMGYSWLIGVDKDDIRFEPINKLPLERMDLRLADRPFGYVSAADAYYLPGTDILVPLGTTFLSCAQQIHKGELIPGVSIPKLQFARNRIQRTSARWARLSDVVTASGMSTTRLMTDYWSFVGLDHDLSRNVRGQLLRVRFGDEAADISCQQSPHQYLMLEELADLIRGGRESSTVWISAGLANTFLRLRALGYQPLADTLTT